MQDLYTKMEDWFEKEITGFRFLLFLIFIIALCYLFPHHIIYLCCVMMCFAIFSIIASLLHIINVFKVRGPNWVHPRCESCKQFLPLEKNGITIKKV